MKRMLKAIGLMLAATVLGLLSVQGSLALWNTSVSSPAQSLGSAAFAVSVKSGNGPVEYLTAGNSTVNLAGQDTLKPGETNTVAIRIGNATDASSGTFRSRISLGTPSTGGELKSHLALSLTKAKGSECSATGNSPASTDLGQDETALYCLTTTLAKDAPATLSGAKGTISVPLTATQL